MEKCEGCPGPAGFITHEMCLERKDKCSGGIYKKLDCMNNLLQRIAGRFGINGEGQQQQEHHRSGEEGEHIHRRLSDLEEAIKSAGIVELKQSAQEDWRVKVMWGIGVFVAVAFFGPIINALGDIIAARIGK